MTDNDHNADYNMMLSPTQAATTTTTTTTKTATERAFMVVLSCLESATPDRACVSWMIVNVLCLVFSVYLGVYNVWVYSQPMDNKEEEAEEQRLEVRATMEYLVWSLATTIVWIVEVSLRAAFPESSQISPLEQYPLKHSQQQQQQKLRILVVEFFLAIFFGVESILDCVQWEDRIEEDEFVQQQVDVWINILAYGYMTYETYKVVTSTAPTNTKSDDVYSDGTGNSNTAPILENEHPHDMATISPSLPEVA
jgi:hypothetical protein